MLYRLTKRVCGAWRDITEDGETFDFDTKAEVLSLLNNVGWKNGRGETLNYREVTDKQLEEESRRYAAMKAYNM